MVVLMNAKLVRIAVNQVLIIQIPEFKAFR